MTPAFDPGGPVNSPDDCNGVLRVSCCTRCRRTEFPGAIACPACGADSSPSALTLPGRLTALTSVEHPPPGGLISTPYHVGVVAFTEGISVLGRVVGEAAIGDAVVPVYDTLSNGTATYAFERVAAVR